MRGLHRLLELLCPGRTHCVSQSKGSSWGHFGSHLPADRNLGWCRARRPVSEHVGCRKHTVPETLCSCITKVTLALALSS